MNDDILNKVDDARRERERPAPEDTECHGWVWLDVIGIQCQLKPGHLGPHYGRFDREVAVGGPTAIVITWTDGTIEEHEISSAKVLRVPCPECEEQVTRVLGYGGRRGVNGGSVKSYLSMECSACKNQFEVDVEWT